MFENSIVCQCTFYFLCAWLCVDWFVCQWAFRWFVGWCVPVGYVEYVLFWMLFGVSAALRWIGWHVIVFNFCGFLFFAPSGWGNFFLCSNFLDASIGCIVVWFVVVCSFVGFRAFHGLFRICSEIFLWRVWSWLRTNAGGVLNTCKSNGKALLAGYSSGERVSNTWVICPALRDKPGKLGLIPDRSHF